MATQKQLAALKKARAAKKKSSTTAKKQTGKKPAKKTTKKALSGTINYVLMFKFDGSREWTSKQYVDSRSAEHYLKDFLYASNSNYDAIKISRKKW